MFEFKQPNPMMYCVATEYSLVYPKVVVDGSGESRQKAKCSAEEKSGTHIQKLLANFMVKLWFFLKKGCGSVGWV